MPQSDDERERILREWAARGKAIAGEDAAWMFARIASRAAANERADVVAFTESERLMYAPYPYENDSDYSRARDAKNEALTELHEAFTRGAHVGAAKKEGGGG